MDLKKYKNTLGKKINIKQSSFAVKNSSSSFNTDKIRVNKLNTSQQIKEKNKIQINIYKRPFKLTNDHNILQQNKIKNNYITKAPNKNQTNDISLSSNSLYDTIDLGRNAINKISINLNKKIKIAQKIKIKSKEKTPFKNKINIQDNKENYQTNIASNKFKNIYKINKTKTNNNFQNKSNNISINNKNHNNYSFFKNNNLLKSTNISKENINNISLRLFKKETISSKNKLKKSILYTPKKRNELNNKNIYSKTRAKTIQQSAKRLSKYLLTSQNSESRFYTNKIFSPETNNNHINKKKRGSL